MAATNFKPGKIKTVYHSPMDVGELLAFAGTLLCALDVWDETHGVNDGCYMCEILEPKEEGADSQAQQPKA